MSFVYIVALRDKTAFKVGKTDDLNVRLVTLSGHHDFSVDLVKLFKCHDSKSAYKFETALKNICNKRMVIHLHDGGTEFFDFSIWDEVIDMAERIAKISGFTDVSPQENESDPLLSLDDMIKNFISRAKCLRLNSNITIAELAKMARVGIRTVDRFENNGNVSLKNAISILHALKAGDSLKELNESWTSFRKRATGTRKKTRIMNIQ